VFDGVAPNMAACLTQADEERRVWELAGAKGISFLMAQLPAKGLTRVYRNGCRCNISLECVWGVVLGPKPFISS
jgi:hypothetical protein